MASLLNALYFLFWAICDLFRLPILRGSAKFAAPEKEKSYRVWRGILFLLLTAVFVYIFLVERVYRIELSFRETLLWFGIPFGVPVCGIFILNHTYQIPPLWERTNR